MRLAAEARRGCDRSNLTIVPTASYAVGSSELKPNMLALLIPLCLANLDSANPDLDRLAGVWLGENGTTLAIDAGTATIIIRSEDGEFVGQLTLYPRLHQLRMADSIGSVERPYRLTGRQLTIGGIVYQRRPFLCPD